MRFLARVASPILTVVNQQRKAWGLKPQREWSEALSTLAQVAQMPAALEFDIPMRDRHPLLHYTGPFVDPQQRPAIDFPWDRLDGRPLIYASLGTLQNGSEDIFRTIAAACASLPVQLVISLGAGLDQQRLGVLAGDPIVVKYAPQLELIKRSAIVITHAGINTALESLSEGVPLVCIPIGNDQPGVAARVAARGAGVVVPARSSMPVACTLPCALSLRMIPIAAPPKNSRRPSSNSTASASPPTSSKMHSKSAPASAFKPQTDAEYATSAASRRRGLAFLRPRSLRARPLPRARRRHNPIHPQILHHLPIVIVGVRDREPASVDSRLEPRLRHSSTSNALAAVSVAIALCPNANEPASAATTSSFFVSFANRLHIHIRLQSANRRYRRSSSPAPHESPAAQSVLTVANSVVCPGTKIAALGANPNFSAGIAFTAPIISHLNQAQLRVHRLRRRNNRPRRWALRPIGAHLRRRRQRPMPITQHNRHHPTTHPKNLRSKVVVLKPKQATRKRSPASRPFRAKPNF